MKESRIILKLYHLWVSRVSLILINIINFTLISVLNESKKSGIISLSKPVVEEALRKVTEFLRIGKTDLVGDFISKSKTIQTQSKYRKEAPMFWNSVMNAASESTTGKCLVMSLSGENSEKIVYYKSDLLISSEDLNSCYFHKKLGKSLIKETTVIYVEVNNLTIRGSERLLSMLKDIKKLFDSRVKVLIVNSSKTLSKEISKLVDIDIKCTGKDASVNLEPPSKKLKIKQTQEFEELREAKTVIKKQEVLLIGKEKNEYSKEYEIISDELRESQIIVQNLELLLKEKEKNEAKWDSEKMDLRSNIAEIKRNCEEECEKVSEELRNAEICVRKLDAILKEKEKTEEKLRSDNKALKVRLAEVESELEGVKKSELILMDKKNYEAESESDKNALRVKLAEVECEVEKGAKRYELILQEKDRIDVERNISLEEVKGALNDKAGELKALEVKLSEAKTEIKELTNENNEMKVEITKFEDKRKSTVDKYTSAHSRAITPEIIDPLSKDGSKTAEVTGELKNKILELEKKFPNAGPIQILHRCCKKLEYNVHFLDKKKFSAHFVCQFKIKSVEFGQYGEELFAGKGVSKAVAKSNAIESLLNLVKS